MYTVSITPSPSVASIDFLPSTATVASHPYVVNVSIQPPSYSSSSPSSNTHVKHVTSVSRVPGCVLSRLSPSCIVYSCGPAPISRLIASCWLYWCRLVTVCTARCPPANMTAATSATPNSFRIVIPSPSRVSTRYYFLVLLRGARVGAASTMSGRSPGC